MRSRARDRLLPQGLAFGRGIVPLPAVANSESRMSPLLTDLYELNMVQAYLDRGETNEAVFEFFVRRLPERRGFLLAAGLDDALDYLETLRFSDDEIAWLKSTGRFRDNLLDYLAAFRFTGDVHAMPEGTVCFRHEPLIAHHRAAAAGATDRNAAASTSCISRR